jgi:hypothetical protein
MDEIVGDVTADVVDSVREQAGKTLKSVKAEVERTAPRASGRFAASFEAYVDTPPTDVPSEGDTTPQSSSDVDAVIASWQPGQAMGLVTNVAQSRRLAFHRWSKKVADGWFELAVTTGVRAAEAAGQ